MYVAKLLDDNNSLFHLLRALICQYIIELQTVLFMYNAYNSCLLSNIHAAYLFVGHDVFTRYDLERTRFHSKHD